MGKRLAVTKVGKVKGTPVPKFHQTVGYTDRNLVPVNPNDQQFQPTDSCPIPNRQKMGGMT